MRALILITGTACCALTAFLLLVLFPDLDGWLASLLSAGFWAGIMLLAERRFLK